MAKKIVKIKLKMKMRLNYELNGQNYIDDEIKLKIEQKEFG